MKKLFMSAPSTIERPEISDGTGNQEWWVVIVYNNDTNTWDEVVDILMRATACCLSEAEIETWEIDRLGKSVVHHAEEDECHGVAEVIRQIGIRVEVASE